MSITKTHAGRSFDSHQPAKELFLYLTMNSSWNNMYLDFSSDKGVDDGNKDLAKFGCDLTSETPVDRQGQLSRFNISVQHQSRLRHHYVKWTSTESDDLNQLDARLSQRMNQFLAALRPFRFFISAAVAQNGQFRFPNELDNMSQKERDQRSQFRFFIKFNESEIFQKKYLF